MDNAKITRITLLRAIAALMVCVVHIDLICDYHISPLIDYLMINGQQGVAIFFVISGFILPYSLYKKNYALKDFFSFLLRRSIRIDPPYWCIIVLLFVTGIVPITLLSFKSVLLHLFYLVPFVKGIDWYSGIFWTLSVEFQFYLLLGIFFPFLMRIKANAAVLILIAVNIICVLSKIDARGTIVDQMTCFIMGFIAFMVYIKKISLPRGVLLLVTLSAYAMVAVSIKSGSVPLLGAMFILFYKSQKQIQPLYFTGNISYSLYLIHMPASFLFVKNLGVFIHNKLLLFILCLLISILAAYIFYLLVERYALKLSKAVRLSR